MSAASIAARLVDALEAHAAQEAGAPCVLVSVNIELLGAPAAGTATVTLERKTRTLIFLSAAFVSESGEPLARAASVHKVNA